MYQSKQLPLAIAVLSLATCGGGNTEPAGGATLAPVTVEGSKATAVTPAGAIAGTAESSTVVFRGIPFAAPPVGNLRWKAPVPAPKWEGTYNASVFAKHCPQENAKTDPNASEDCLYLNVYAPKSAATSSGAKRPVMVWIHGGANAFGASDSYDPTSLVETGDVVVVTLNYRLGALGFLAHPALRTESGTAANYGVMDQQLALKWVKENIAGFGGDASNVTIFGESAGGLNVTSHLVSAGSAGLFHKAVIQSSGYLLETPTLAEAEAKGSSFASRVGCSDQSLACLRSKSVSEILNAQGTVNTDSAAYFQMFQDGAVLKESHDKALAGGRFHRVPVMVGSNSNEGNLWYGSTPGNEAQYNAVAAAFSLENHKDTNATKAAYLLSSYATPGQAASAILGDSEFSCPTRKTANWFASHVPTYTYEFSDPAALFKGGHFDDIYYLFHYKGAPAVGISGGSDSKALSLAMRRYWTSFARNGDPNGNGTPTWNAYRPAQANLHLLMPPVPREDMAAAAENFVTRHKCNYWGL